MVERQVFVVDTDDWQLNPLAVSGEHCVCRQTMRSLFRISKEYAGYEIDISRF